MLFAFSDLLARRIGQTCCSLALILHEQKKGLIGNRTFNEISMLTTSKEFPTMVL